MITTFIIIARLTENKYRAQFICLTQIIYHQFNFTLSLRYLISWIQLNNATHALNLSAGVS